jgi:hypothetical protein
LFFVSGAQTPSPLIRPADSDFGGTEGGEGQKQNGDDWSVCGYYFGFTHSAQ